MGMGIATATRMVVAIVADIGPAGTVSAPRRRSCMSRPRRDGGVRLFMMSGGGRQYRAWWTQKISVVRNGGVVCGCSEDTILRLMTLYQFWDGLGLKQGETVFLRSM